MKTQVSPGNTLTPAAPYALSSGDGAQVGSMFGVAASDAANAASVVLWLTGEFSLKKVSAQAWTVGQLIYWDNTAKNATSAAGTANVKIGFATAVAANPSATGHVRLNGSF